MNDASPAAASTTDPRFPVGKQPSLGPVDAAAREQALQELGELPQNLRQALRGLEQDDLETPYREGGWTVRQVVHHLADSHMNMYVRVRLALTEENPTVRPYEEKDWALLHDASDAPVEWSEQLLEALHARLLMLLRSLSNEQWQRPFTHPAMGVMTVEQSAVLYAWHSKHHVAHITTLRAQQDW